MVQYAPLDINKIRNLISDIQYGLKELSVLSGLTLEEFKSDSRNYGLAEHYLRRSLEGVLTIGTHILSRMPVKTKDYQQIIVSLGEFGVIPKDFAEKNKKLAGYRNRLVHMYWEVSKDELYNVLKEHLADLDKFCEYFQNILRDPKKLGLKID